MEQLTSQDRRIYVAGHRGMVGSAILRALKRHRCHNIVTRAHEDLDLSRQTDVADFLAAEHIDEIYLSAARVGGIHANHTYPAEFIYQNLMIEANVIHGAWARGIKKLLFLGSSCIYPRVAAQPMAEETLLTGPLEPTNEPYAIAKIAGIKLCESYNRQFGTDFRSVMPTNLYGPGDNYHPTNSHVLPAMIQRFHDAKISGAEAVSIWGTGTPQREFLHVDDMAEACLHVMSLPMDTYASTTAPMMSHINVGSGDEIAIRALAELVADIVGYTGRLVFDADKPDGTPRKLIDSAKLAALGWRAKISLREGLLSTYANFTANALT